MRIRFQADADLNEVIVSILLRRVPEMDFQTATTAGLEGLGDAEVLSIAAGEGRILVSHDQSTMGEHFGQFVAENESPGVFIIPQHLSPFVAADELLLVWFASEPNEWTNRICYLPL
jgi:hypothetical protein